MSAINTAIKSDLAFAMHTPANFARYGRGLPLRAYQVEPLNAIVESVQLGLGRTFCVVVSRQGGKNHLQAELQAWLLLIMAGSRETLNMVVASPTYKPQTENAINRLRLALESNLFTKYLPWRKRGYIFQLGNASITFLSAEPGANVVGATANLMLMADESQDILPDVWRVRFLPMAASTNATVVHFGTIWTDDTLLDQEISHAQAAQNNDGIKRLFLYDCDAVAKENPAYGEFVRGQVERLGRENIAIKTQFYLEKVSAIGGMFPPERIALMAGNHPAEYAPTRGMYAASVDFGGNVLDGHETRHNATILTVARVVFGDGLPKYEIVYRKRWVISHDALYRELLAVLGVWCPAVLLLDAGGVGAGLCAMLSKIYVGAQLIQFTAQLKSWLGYRLMSAVDMGRLKEYQPLADNSLLDREQSEFWRECKACKYEIKPGVGRLMSWGVPDGTVSGGLPVGDDALFSCAMLLFLDDYKFPDLRALPPVDDVLDVLAVIDGGKYG